MEDIYNLYSLSRIHADWANLTRQSHRLTDKAFRSEVLSYGREIMSHARSCVLHIIDHLNKLEYRWVDESRVYKTPDENVQEWIDYLAEAEIFIPISLQAWLLEVGNVNLTGSLLTWRRPAYVFNNEKNDCQNIIYTDPLVVEISRDYVDYLYTEWGERKEQGPFLIDIAPDHIHKANISGGLPYMVESNRPIVDSILYNERHCTTFTGYIRRAIYWRGFPGFDYINNGEIEWSPDINMTV